MIDRSRIKEIPSLDNCEHKPYSQKFKKEEL